MKDIIHTLETLQTTAEQEFFATTDQESLNHLRVKYLGKKSQITQAMKLLGEVSPEQRPLIGKKINDVKKFCKRCTIPENVSLPKKRRKKKWPKNALMSHFLGGGVLSEKNTR
jgi:phenylalanyl-tRNA synthetase alpha chain